LNVPERVVIDTNIWISGLLWRGKPYQCLLLARTGVVQAVYCQAMASELSEKLRQKFGFPVEHIQAVLYDLRRSATRVEITGTLKTVPNDPEDDKFVECAVVAGATTIVSGDRHLLELGQYREIRIVTAAQFVEYFRQSEDVEEEL
jgi:putative PIN family toxin of toxin-antitoxin system